MGRTSLKETWPRWIVEHRRLNVLFLIITSVVASIGYYDPTLLVGANKEDNSSVNAPQKRGGSGQRRSRLGQADVVVVAISNDFFTPAGAAAMREVVRRLEDQPTVSSVMWLDRAPPLNVFGLPEPIFPRATASQARFEQAKQKAQSNPLIVGQMMSPDARTLLLLVRMDWLYVRSNADCNENLKAVAIDAAKQYPEASIRFAMTGDAPMTLAILASNEANRFKYQIIGYCIILTLSLLLFRGLSAVTIVAAAPALGVFWALAAVRFLDMQDNPFNDVVLPIMISLIGFTDGVHMMVQIRKQRALGKPPVEATTRGLRDVGAACLLTLFTTSIGFASLGLAHHEIVREFGMACVVGIFIQFIAVISVIPLATASRLGRNLHIGQDKGLIDRNLAKISVIIDFSIRHARRISYVAILGTLFLAAITFTLRPDETLANALPAGSEPQWAMAHLDTALGGLQTSEARITWPDRLSATDPEVFAVIAAVEELLRSEPLIGSPIGITTLLRALPGEGEMTERISMIELLPIALKDNYLSMEDKTAKVSFRVQDLGIAAYGPVFERIEAGLAEVQTDHPGFYLNLTGNAVERWRNLYQIVLDLGSSLGSEAIIILILLAVTYRSMRLGLIAFVPNIFQLALTGACLVMLRQPLELVSVCAFTVCLGIAVDDTIHFLTRYREELENGLDEVAAVRSAFIGVGTGMIMTTIVLVAGFTTVLMSEVRDHRVFCAMGALTLSAALFSDLFFLPALLVHFRRKPSKS